MVDASEPERENPWLLLRRREPDGLIPAIADATSLQYVLHRGVGDDLDTGRVDANGRPVRLRIVASLADSVLQGEIVIADEQFRKALPNEAGYRFFLVDIAGSAGGDNRAPGVATLDSRVAVHLEERLSDLGFDATNAADRLAAVSPRREHYTSPLFRRLVRWGCCWAQSASARSRCGTSLSGGGNSGCCGLSGTVPAISARWCSPRTRCC